MDDEDPLECEIMMGWDCEKETFFLMRRGAGRPTRGFAEVCFGDDCVTGAGSAVGRHQCSSSEVAGEDARELKRLWVLAVLGFENTLSTRETVERLERREERDSGRDSAWATRKMGCTCTESRLGCIEKFMDIGREKLRLCGSGGRGLFEDALVERECMVGGGVGKLGKCEMFIWLVKLMAAVRPASLMQTSALW